MKKNAIISECGKYRYQLSRIWDEAKPLIIFMMLNPSTADAEQDDPTIRRLIGFATQRGFGGFYVVNLYAFRTKDPEELFVAKGDGVDIEGAENNEWIKTTRALGAIFICAWGAHGNSMAWFEGSNIYKTMPVFSFGYTKYGFPKHPLYLAAETAWQAENTLALTYEFPDVFTEVIDLFNQAMKNDKAE